MYSVHFIEEEKIVKKGDLKIYLNFLHLGSGSSRIRIFFSMVESATRADKATGKYGLIGYSKRCIDQRIRIVRSFCKY